MDAKTAFLYGDLKEEIYMRQPVGFEENDKEHLVCCVCLRKAYMVLSNQQGHGIRPFTQY